MSCPRFGVLSLHVESSVGPGMTQKMFVFQLSCWLTYAGQRVCLVTGPTSHEKNLQRAPRAVPSPRLCTVLYYHQSGNAFGEFVAKRSAVHG